MNANLQKRIADLIRRTRQENWDDVSFSLKKAHICAEFSALVYEDVREYELKRQSRLHLFASDEYRKIVSSGSATNLANELSGGDFEARFFVVRGRNAVTLGTVIGDVVILAIRGTVFLRLWDWRANVDARRYPCLTSRYDYDDLGRVFLHGELSFRNGDFGDMFVHRGFFESIVPQFDSIVDAIAERLPAKSPVKIVWTGHSLGGGMAAIANALMYPHFRYRQHLSDHNFDWRPAGSYTFGMPRYGGLGVVCCRPGPYHIYNSHDVVPTVPTRSMGFADAAREYEVADAGSISLTERTDTSGVLGHMLRLHLGIKAHSIDAYARALAASVKLPRP